MVLRYEGEPIDRVRKLDDQFYILYGTEWHYILSNKEYAHLTQTNLDEFKGDP